MKVRVSTIDFDKVDASRAESKRARKLRFQHRKRRMIRLVDKQFDWDYGEIYQLIAMKLRNIRDYAETDTVTYLENWRLDWLDRAVALCDHLSSVHKYPQHININNAGRFHEARDIKFHDNERMQQMLDNCKSDIYKDCCRKIDFDRISAENFYDIKARHLLFKIMTNYIENWWD